MASSINASTSGAGGVITTADNTGILNLQTASTTAVTVNTTQYVGINNTSPASSLDVTGHSASNGYYNFKGYSTGRGYGSYTNSSGTVVGYIGNGGGGSMNTGAGSDFGISAASNLLFSAGGSLNEQMRITSTGNVGIGNDNPTGYNNAFTAITTSSYLPLFVGNTNTSATGAGVIIAKWLNSNATSNILMQFLINGVATGSGQINANGASAAAFGSYSDARLKENIEPLPPQLDNILALKPSEFDYKDGSGHQIGFIAQEMQEVYPDAVAAGEDEMLMITGWDKTTARLVKAIQEQQTIINDLKARIETLEAK